MGSAQLRPLRICSARMYTRSRWSSRVIISGRRVRRSTPHSTQIAVPGLYSVWQLGQTRAPGCRGGRVLTVCGLAGAGCWATWRSFSPPLRRYVPPASFCSSGKSGNGSSSSRISESDTTSGRGMLIASPHFGHRARRPAAECGTLSFVPQVQVTRILSAVADCAAGAGFGAAGCGGLITIVAPHFGQRAFRPTAAAGTFTNTPQEHRCLIVELVLGIVKNHPTARPGGAKGIRDMSARQPLVWYQRTTRRGVLSSGILVAGSGIGASFALTNVRHSGVAFQIRWMRSASSGGMCIP